MTLYCRRVVRLYIQLDDPTLGPEKLQILNDFQFQAKELLI